jgi:hypothetical protein
MRDIGVLGESAVEISPIIFAVGEAVLSGVW